MNGSMDVKYQNPQRSDPLLPDIGFPGHVTATATLPRGGYVISEDRLLNQQQRTPPPPGVQPPKLPSKQKPHHSYNANNHNNNRFGTIHRKDHNRSYNSSAES